ncbi:MAG TPA: hypothetical protein VF316_10820 [Polyangiaceae bacterium]
MRRRSYILGAVLALALAAMGVACSLNPQPYPPGNNLATDDAGANSDAVSPFGDASFGEAGGGEDAAPPKGDAGADAGIDAATDGGGDAGDADVPSDAALAEGG